MHRAAYQLNGLLVLPVILFLIPQTIVLFMVTWRALYIVASGLVLVDLVLVAAALALFDRERLLQGAG